MMGKQILKVNQLFARTIFLITLVFPLGLGSLLILRKVLIKEAPLSFGPLIIFILLFIILIILQIKTEAVLEKIRYEKYKKLYFFLAVIVLAGLAVAWRLILIYKFQTPQVNEYYVAYDMAKKWIDGPSASTLILLAPRWGIYALVLSKLFIFGQTLFIAKLISVFIAAISSVFIFLTVFKSTKKYLLALSGGLILSLWPAFAGYSNILSGEHFFIMFFSISLFCLVYALDYHKKSQKFFFLFVILFSIFIALANVFRDTTVITIPASIIIFAYFISQNNSYLRKKTIDFALIVILLLSTSIVFNGVRDSLVSYYAKGPINKSSIGYFLATGLNIENSGRYKASIGEPSVELFKEKLKKNEIDKDFYKKTNDKLMNVALSEIRENYREFPLLFAKKFSIVWSNEDEINNLNYDNFTLSGIKPKNMTLDQLKSTLKTFNLFGNSYYLMVMLLATAGAFFIVRKKREINPDLYFSSVMVLGFATALLVIEILTRYRSILYPAITIQATYGIYFLSEYIKSKKLKDVSL